MEIVQRKSQSAVPLIAVVAIVAAVLISMAAWASAHPSTVGSTGAQQVTATSTSLNPDATDRNAAVLAARLGQAEATHGH